MGISTYLSATSRTTGHVRETGFFLLLNTSHCTPIVPSNPRTEEVKRQAHCAFSKSRTILIGQQLYRVSKLNIAPEMESPTVEPVIPYPGICPGYGITGSTVGDSIYVAMFSFLTRYSCWPISCLLTRYAVNFDFGSLSRFL